MVAAMAGRDYHRIVYLLCELKARDFEPRLLIAGELLKAGCAVVIGQRWGIAHNAPTAPRGCTLFPTANAIQAATMETVAQGGHAIVAGDEEALALAGDALLEILAPGALRHEGFFAHSDLHAAVVGKAFPDARITVTGSARIDLSLAAARGGARPGKAADYILFNTNFPLTNSLWGDAEAAAAQLAKAGLADVPERVAFETARRESLTPVLAWAVDALDRPIVIRPHPAENPQTWQALAAGKHHVRVVTGESPGPWLAGAALVVHADCTTGLEAAVMGRPVLNVSAHDRGARFVMRLVNSTVATPEAAIAALRDFIAGTPLPAPARSANDLYPPHGARRTAQALMALLTERDARPLGGAFTWQPVARPDILKQKITVTRDEVARSPHIVPTRAAIHQIDESLFLLVPPRAGAR
jgi:surface carbohydrate biosynthesis protein